MGGKWCECNVAAEFKELNGLGIISANLRSNMNFTIGETGLILYGPASGDLSLTAYAPLEGGEQLDCPGRAGAQFDWAQFMECEDDTGFRVHFVPNGRNRAYREGDVTKQIGLSTLARCGTYSTFSANASSGPTTVSLRFVHQDGYSLTYSGDPIQVKSDSGTEPTIISFFGGILPAGSKLYMSNFSWEHNPPEIPIVNYSFLFSYVHC